MDKANSQPISDAIQVSKKQGLNFGDLMEMNLSNPSYYLNREISLLAFNWRVLQQALDTSIPLLERIRFIFICSNNLDEFFEVRVAGLRHDLARGDTKPSLNGASTEEVLREINERAHELVDEQYRIFNEELMPKLAEESIQFLPSNEWNDEQYKWH